MARAPTSYRYGVRAGTIDWLNEAVLACSKCQVSCRNKYPVCANSSALLCRKFIYLQAGLNNSLTVSISPTCLPKLTTTFSLATHLRPE